MESIIDLSGVWKYLNKTHKITRSQDNTPPRTNLNAGFLDNGHDKSGNAERRVYDINISTRSFRIHHLHRVCPPCLRELGSGIRPVNRECVTVRVIRTFPDEVPAGLV